MILIGHPLIASPNFIGVKSIEELLQKSSANDIVVLNELSVSSEVAQFCHKNQLAYALHCCTIKEAILANALGATYCIVPSSEAKKLQEIATEYLFDTKIVALIDTEDMLEALAIEGIDGVIFSHKLNP
jgi:hypothetical protein